MVFFEYLANILQHSCLNGCFHEDSENKIVNVFSVPVFIVTMVISVKTHYNYKDYKVKICAQLISF